METYYAVNTTNSLYHHGIKGMKWGRRRYQNENGSLTPAGRDRYGRLYNNAEWQKDASVSLHERLDSAKKKPKYQKAQSKWTQKRDEARAKSAKYSVRAQRARDNMTLYNKEPSRWDQRALNKQYKWDKKAAKYDKRISSATRKVSRLTLRSAKADRRYERAKNKADKFLNKYIKTSTDWTTEEKAPKGYRPVNKVVDGFDGFRTRPTFISYYELDKKKKGSKQPNIKYV